MPRRPRAFLRGYIFHVLNRAARRGRLFDSPDDYDAFIRVLEKAHAERPVAIFAYCIMPNHWHLVVSANESRQLSAFMHMLTTTHSRRWGVTRAVAGEGAVYQGRFRAIPVQEDAHFLWVCRYVERNALRAGLVDRAEDWPWSSLHLRSVDGSSPLLAAWPVAVPRHWAAEVNRPQTAQEIAAFRRAVHEQTPYGDLDWCNELAGATKRKGRPKPRTAGPTGH